MQDASVVVAWGAMALAVGVLAGSVVYVWVGMGAGRKVRVLEGQVEHLKRQLASPRAADLRPLIDALPDPMILTDDQERVTLLNAAAGRLLALPPGSAMGKPFVSVVTDQQLLEIFDAVRKAPRTEQRPLAQKELKLTRSSGRFVFQAVAVRNPGGAVLLLLRDVTQMAGIVQMKTNFVSNAGHELRTPVAAIKAAFETLSDVMDDDREQRDKCVTIIHGHIRRLEEMLGDLLDLSRVETPDLQAQVREIRAGEAFSMVATTMAHVARDKGLELVFEGPAEDGAFVTDPRLLNLVLKNLVENALKFTPAGGKVRVSIELDEQGETVAAQGVGPAFRLAVADTGVGIAPEHVDRVFERFYQVDPARTGSATRGTGLGLAIVKHAVAVLGGVVELKSEVGHGTTITCRFPGMRAGERTGD